MGNDKYRVSLLILIDLDLRHMQVKLVLGNLRKLLLPTLLVQTNNRKLWCRRGAGLMQVFAQDARSHFLALCAYLVCLWAYLLKFQEVINPTIRTFSAKLLGRIQTQGSSKVFICLFQATYHVIITTKILLSNSDIISVIKQFTPVRKEQLFSLLLCSVESTAQRVQIILWLSFNLH